MVTPSISPTVPYENRTEFQCCPCGFSPVLITCRYIYYVYGDTWNTEMQNKKRWLKPVCVCVCTRLFRPIRALLCGQTPGNINAIQEKLNMVNVRPISHNIHASTFPLFPFLDFLIPSTSPLISFFFLLNCYSSIFPSNCLYGPASSLLTWSIQTTVLIWK